MEAKKPEMIEVWCVKYALTQGVFMVKGYASDCCRFTCPDSLHQSFGPSEWACNLDVALRMAVDMRENRIAILGRQIDTMLAMTINAL